MTLDTINTPVASLSPVGLNFSWTPTSSLFVSIGYDTADLTTTPIKTPITFTAATSLPEHRSVVNYEWKMGDGTVYQTGAPTIIHTYTVANFQARASLVITDDLGNDYECGHQLYLSLPLAYGGIILGGSLVEAYSTARRGVIHLGGSVVESHSSSRVTGNIILHGSVVESYTSVRHGNIILGGSVVESWLPPTKFYMSGSSVSSAVSAWQVNSGGTLSFVGDSAYLSEDSFVCVVPSGAQYAYLSGTNSSGSPNNVYLYTIHSSGVLVPIAAQPSITLPVSVGSIQTVTPDKSVMLFPGGGFPWGTGTISAYRVNSDGTLTTASTYDAGPMVSYGSTSGAIAVASDSRTVYLYNSYRLTLTKLTMSALGASFSVDYLVGTPGPGGGAPSRLHISADDRILVASDTGGHIRSYDAATGANIANLNPGTASIATILDSNNHLYIADTSGTVYAYNMDSGGHFTFINSYAPASWGATYIAEGNGQYVMCISAGTIETSYTLSGAIPVESSTLAMPSTSAWITTV
jgi:6-phosphogluconolactonase (cycloisomerase 2 family)